MGPAEAYLRFSAFTVVLSACMVFFFPDLWLEQMPVLLNLGVTLPEVQKLSPLLAMFMLSSGAGKTTAVLQGPAAIAQFCRLNLFATSCLVLLCAAQADWRGLVTWGGFAVAYGFFGFRKHLPVLGVAHPKMQ